MIIQWPMDVARGFDELSIQTLKVNESREAVPAYEAAVNALVTQLGAAKVDEIEGSPEYAALYAVNQQVFDAINWLAKEGERPGDHMAMNGPKGLNHQRWLAKRALQERWFPGAELTERKVGYTEEQS